MSSLAARAAECRPANEDALRGIPSEEVIIGAYPVHLLPSAIKSLTTKHGGKIQSINIQMGKSNQYSVAYSLNERVIGGEL